MRGDDRDWFGGGGPLPAPAVVFWYRVYCVGLVLFALVIFAAAYFLSTLPANPRKPEDQFARVFIIGLYALGGVLCLATGVVPFFFPRRPWAWTAHLVIICLGLTGGCTIFPCAFLLIYWLKPGTKRYFGRE